MLSYGIWFVSQVPIIHEYLECNERKGKKAKASTLHQRQTEDSRGDTLSQAWTGCPDGYALRVMAIALCYISVDRMSTVVSTVVRVTPQLCVSNVTTHLIIIIIIILLRSRAQTKKGVSRNTFCGRQDGRRLRFIRYHKVIYEHTLNQVPTSGQITYVLLTPKIIA